MAKHWEDKGAGQWKLIITDDQSGEVLSTFYGSKDEIADKQADSLANASRRINELRGTNGSAAPNHTPRSLSAAERLQTVSDLNNPATVDQGVLRIVESAVGPVAELRQDREADRMDRRERAAINAAETFADQTPDWYPSDYNKEALIRFMQLQGLDPTRPQHYTQAFEKLSAAQLLQPKPADSEPENLNNEPPAGRERNAPTPTQQPPAATRFSTSIRHSDISGARPTPTTRLKYSREQIARMGAAQYRRLMTSDPELSRSVEYYARQDQAKQRRMA